MARRKAGKGEKSDVSVDESPKPLEGAVSVDTRNEEAVKSVLNEFKWKMEVGIQEIKDILDMKLNNLSENLDEISMSHSENQKNKTRKPPRKQFIPRESILSAMLDNDADENYRTIFNIALCVLIIWGSSLAFDDYTKSGLPNFDLLSWGIYRDLGRFFFNWIMMFMGSFVILFLAHFAAETKNKLTYYLINFVYFCFQVYAFIFSAKVVYFSHYQFAMPLAIGFMAEQARMSMKAHSYYREKVAHNVFKQKFVGAPKSSSRIPILDVAIPEPNYFFGEIYKFGVFHFAPTLIFRDSYPRVSRINWQSIVMRSGEALGIVYFAFLIFREVLPKFSDNYYRKLSTEEFIRLTFACMGPAMACMIFTHFLVLHVVQNIGAELTRFADRGFYEDWWNSRTFSVFYRKWNGVVHDFIHCYMYTDFTEFLKLPKMVALLSSFILSAIIHEYLICVAMGFFLPILGVMFTGPGLIFILLTKNKTGRIWNIFMWLMLSIGNAFLMVLYIREYYARFYNIGAPSDDLNILGVNIKDHAHHDLILKGYDFLFPRTFRIQYQS